jgi:hypothetical protein
LNVRDEKYGVEVTFNGMTSVPNFMKNLPLDSKVIKGKHTYRQTDNMVICNPHFPFKKSRLKTVILWTLFVEHRKKQKAFSLRIPVVILS